MNGTRNTGVMWLFCDDGKSGWSWYRLPRLFWTRLNYSPINLVIHSQLRYAKLRESEIFTGI